MATTYRFITWEEEGIWTSHAPAVPGVYGLGDTPAAAEKDLADSMESLSEYLGKIGEKLPMSSRIHTGNLRI